MNSFVISFLDLLRRRRELPLLEVVRLCGELPRQLDERSRLGPPGPLFLSEVFVTLTGDKEDKKRLLDTPVSGWPAFTARLAEPDEEAADRTFASNTKVDQDGGSAQVALARLLYELLGGTQRAAGPKQRLPPLPALNENGNNMLRQALAGGADRESCAVFWQKWLRACEVAMQPDGWRIPRWLLRVAQPGTLLRLIPEAKDGLELALVARPLFRIGRSRNMSDFPTRILDRDGELDEERTVQVSRVQAIGRWSEQGLTWQDGNGERPSANGTLWNGEPLGHAAGTPFAVGGELFLGGVYRLAASPIPGLPGRAPAILNFAEWQTPPGPLAPTLDFSAVVFRPLEGQAPSRDTAWIGRGLGFQLTRDRGLSWDATGTRSQAQFLFSHGCFWLANTALESVPLLLNEALLEPGQIAPLAEGQDLSIAGRRYEVGVED